MNSINSAKLILWSTMILLSCVTNDALLETPLVINCGLPVSSPSTSSVDNRVWRSDDDLAFAPPNIHDVSSVVTTGSSNDYFIPFNVARLFWSPLTYSFSLSPGPIFLRLYFSPTLSFNDTPPHLFSTSLVVNNYFTLLHNFNPFLNAPLHKPFNYEFHLILQNGQNNLNLTFSPPKIDNATSYGYVNGIEIRPVPDGLYINNSTTNNNYVTEPGTGYTYDTNSSTFQTVYRINAGGEYVGVTGDSPGGMMRTWEADDKYMVGDFQGSKVETTPGDANYIEITYTNKTPAYVAPKIVYATTRIMGDFQPQFKLARNLTWMFEVDPGFDYLVRLHMRELDRADTGVEKKLFNVYIHDLLAQQNLDVLDESGGFAVPMYTDYILTLPASDTNASKVPLYLALHPVRCFDPDVLLNGLEILKLSNNGNLAVPNPPYNASATPDQNQKPPKKKHLIIVGGIIGGLLLVSGILLALLRRRVQYKKLFNACTSSSKGQWLPTSVESHSSLATTDANSSRPSLPSDLCRRFSLSQIRVATCDFDENLVIGTGGFGKVYKGCMDGGETNVAIKRQNPSSKQGAHEFLTEIEMLSRLRHVHLVSLIGYCDDQGEMILVYEYMPRGTLRDHLSYKDTKSKDNNEVLSWKQRLTICLGSARGLDYLHAGAKQLIIHRDVKSVNILLDDKWTAKVSDFGLSKVGPGRDTGLGHVSTAVKGSVGYLDPEYNRRGQLTEKSDVYSFGVVLFEVLCARPAANLNLPREQVNLANWARTCYKKGILHTIVDPNLTGQIAPDCLKKFGEIAEMCVRNNGEERPSMRDVVWSLDFALTLQKTAEKNTSDDSPMVEVWSHAIDSCSTNNDVFTKSVGENLSQSRGDDDDDDTQMFGSNSESTTTTANTITTNNYMNIKSGSVFSEILDPRAR